MGAKNIYERFLWFDQKVRAGRFPNATQLAAEFEVSAKTAQRDIEFMRDRLGCPLLYDTAKRGYYYGDDTFVLPSLYVSSEELTALLIVRQLLQGISAGHLGGELSLLIDKISAILTQHVAGGTSIDNAVSIRLIGYAPPGDEVFRAVLDACLRKKVLSMTYYSPVSNEETTRQVDPYHLFNYMGTWHLVGYCHLRQGLRDFNLSRITAPQTLEQEFRMRPDFSRGILRFSLRPLQR